MILFILSVAHQTTLGFATNTQPSYQSFHCMRKRGHQFVMLYATDINGHINPNLSLHFKITKKTGFDKIDLLMPTCQSMPNEQHLQPVKEWMKEKRFNGRLWIELQGDIQQEYCRWNERIQENCKYLHTFTFNIMKLGYEVGVSARKRDWVAAVGHECEMSHRVIVCYRGVDNQMSFGSYKQFGGWEMAVMKQLKEEQEICGIPARIFVFQRQLKAG